jgi:hypothetical protein
MLVFDVNGSLFERNIMSANDKNEVGSDGSTAKSVVGAMLLGISIGLSSPEVAWVQEKHTPAGGTEAFV